MSDPVQPDDLSAAHAVDDRPHFAMPEERWQRLFQALGKGQRSALGELYEVAADRLFGLALWRTGSADDAAEVVQEVFVRLAERARQLAKVRNPRAWLLTVAHRLAVDMVRRRSRRGAASLDQCALLAAPENDRDRSMDAERASRLVADLPPKQRDVVYLKHYAECSFAEAGRILGVPTFTAASRYRLGMEKLRSRLHGGD